MQCLAGSEPKSPIGVKQAGGVLQVHVVAGGAGLPVATLEEEDFLGYPRGDGRGEAAFAGRDAGESGDVSSASAEQTTDTVTNHLAGERRVRDNVSPCRAVLKSREERMAMRAAERGVGLFLAQR